MAGLLGLGVLCDVKAQGTGFLGSILRKGGEPDPASCSMDAVTAGTSVHSHKPH